MNLEPFGAVAVLEQPPRPLWLAVGMLKGGVGKSTSAWLLLCELAARGYTALGVDADPSSQTLADTYRQAFENGYQVPFSVVSWPSAPSLVQGVRAAAVDHRATAVVVDVGGGGDTPEIFDQACVLCDDLLIPVGTSPAELRRIPATMTAAARVNGFSAVNPSVLLVKTDSRTRDEAAAREWLGSAELPVMTAHVPYAIGYQRVLGHVAAAGETGAYADVLTELLSTRDQEAHAA
jgi:CobQ/CobB/MinD/ParA family nucleotide binding protein